MYSLPDMYSVIYTDEMIRKWLGITEDEYNKQFKLSVTSSKEQTKTIKKEEKYYE